MLYVKVEIWSDFICPFCYIGKKRFELALEQFPHKECIQVEFISFQLEPHVIEEPQDITVFDMLMDKYGQSLEQVKAMTNNITAEGHDVGLTFNFEKMNHTGTFHAHRLMKLAKKHGKADELAHRLFKSYFSEGKRIGDKDVLYTLALEVGISAEEADETLSLNCYSKSVHSDQALARDLGIQSVPFFIFNDKYAVPGAQPVDVFLNVLQETWEELEKDGYNDKRIENHGESYCTGDDCHLKDKE